MNALEFMTRAQWRVYQNIPSFATIDTIAAMRAMRLGVAVSRYDPVAMLSKLEYPIAKPVNNRMRPKARDATLSNRSCP